MRNYDDATPERCCGWPIILALVSVHVDDDEGRSTESSVLLLFAFLLHGKLTDPDLTAAAAAAAIKQTER